MSRSTMADMHFVEGMRKDQDEGDFPAGDNVKGMARYYGKYRGVVVASLDPEARGRLLVRVPDVTGPNITNWARPCMPWGGMSMGSYIVPPPETNVWVEFEQGDPNSPIWVGCFWGTALETPAMPKLVAPGAPIFAVESFAKHGFAVTDMPLLPYLPSGGIFIGNAAAGIAIDITGVRIFGPVVHLGAMPGDIAGVTAALLVK
ncbi:phage baseplate assembly protein V [Rhizobacter sp. Root1221]|uniref:phage baseplate assembly protein V n=1 Tax=Rhizobacter sp. Root1221 TaxID=1736433 RepID=UPI0006F1DA64|nr:phage baseplate assembly protein V [Rhizobacter sp. Root1221]KQW02335.1 hypothetical protein ASC87_14040 [Rhizobacter sp. Root1221]